MLQELSCARAVANYERESREGPSHRAREGDGTQAEQLDKFSILVIGHRLFHVLPVRCQPVFSVLIPLSFSILCHIQRCIPAHAT